MSDCNAEDRNSNAQLKMFIGRYSFRTKYCASRELPKIFPNWKLLLWVGKRIDDNDDDRSKIYFYFFNDTIYLSECDFNFDSTLQFEIITKQVYYYFSLFLLHKLLKEISKFKTCPVKKKCPIKKFFYRVNKTEKLCHM